MIAVTSNFFRGSLVMMVFLMAMFTNTVLSNSACNTSACNCQAISSFKSAGTDGKCCPGSTIDDPCTVVSTSCGGGADTCTLCIKQACLDDNMSTKDACNDPICACGDISNCG